MRGRHAAASSFSNAAARRAVPGPPPAPLCVQDMQRASPGNRMSSQPRRLALVAPAPTSQRARAYEGFTQQILAGGIVPGQFVSQRELVALLEMPLGAVREMIPRLEAAGLVRTVPQRGLQIAPVDLKLVRNAFQLRAMVEREAMHHFAHTASDAELATIAAAHQDVLDRLHNSHADPTSLDEARAVDWQLHQRMVDALGNDIVSELYRVNTLRIRLIRMERAAPTAAELVPAVQEHLHFIEALRARAPRRAWQVLRSHLDNARARALAQPAGPSGP